MVKVKVDMSGWIMSEHGVPESRIKIIRQMEDYVTSTGAHYAQWLCECMCEEHNQFVAMGQDLRSGHTKSCGCYNRQKLIAASKKYNVYEKRQDENGEYYVGWTTNTNREFYFDVDDYKKVKDYCWFESWNKDKSYHFVATHDNTKNIKFHQLIGYKSADHKDRDPFNNRKSNLRVATHQENCWNRGIQKSNSSGIIGVCWAKRERLWRSYIKLNDKQISLGYYINKDDATRARLEAEAKYFGEFSPQQNLFEQYGVTK